MHDFDAGRIFWKEWRVQRSFWLGLFGLAIVLQLLLTAVRPLFGPLNGIDQLHFHQGLAIVLACSFATGSAAIAFAGEVESKTKGLLQRLPVRTGDLIAAKLSISLLGSYALVLGIGLVGLVLLAQSSAMAHQFSRPNLSEEFVAFSSYLAGPIVFAVVGGLFSLILTDVLLTVLIAAVASAALLAIPLIRDHFAAQGVLILLVAICDVVLARRWLKDAGAVQWTFLPRISFPRLGRLPSAMIEEKAIPSEAVRSPVAWRRAAGSLIWKEFRQAILFCLAILAVCLLCIGLVPFVEYGTWRGSEVFLLGLVVIAPLLPGVAAMRAERRGEGFRLLAHRGVAPEGFLICKHAVWIILSCGMFAAVLLFDRSFLATRSWPRSSLWDFVSSVTQTTFLPDQFGGYPSTELQEQYTAALFAVALFHVILLYALGFLLSLLTPGPIVAFFSGALVWMALALFWMLIAFLRIPFWWTIGLFPLIFLAVAWVRTADWLTGRNAGAARLKAAAVFVMPMAAMLTAIIVYRVHEIPAATIPPAVLDASGPSIDAKVTGAAPSQFVPALQALTSPLAVTDRVIEIDGWSSGRPRVQEWVRENARARDLALEASRRIEQETRRGVIASRPADRPMMIATPGHGDFWALSLTQLLLDSAREGEWQSRLDDALSCYVAAARLRRDTSLPLNWMASWAARPGQTSNRIKKAIREFEGLDAENATLTESTLADWRTNRLMLEQALRQGANTPENKRTVSELWWVRWFLPWELVRQSRLLDAVRAYDLKQAEAVDVELRRQGFVAMTAERMAAWGWNVVPEKYWRTTLNPPEGIAVLYQEPQFYINRVALAHLHLINLAIIDFKREHKKLPDSLAALVPGYFAHLPIDPWTGQEFLYEREGLPDVVDFPGGRLEPHTPFLVSAGIEDSRLVRRTLPPGTATTFAPGANRSVGLEVVSGLSPPTNPLMPMMPLRFSGPGIELSKGQPLQLPKRGIEKDLLKSF